MKTKNRLRKAVIFEKHCVACGCCCKVCPVHAVSVDRGLRAVIDYEKCVGCGKCAAECPASVIEIKEVKV